MGRNTQDNQGGASNRPQRKARPEKRATQTERKPGDLIRILGENNTALVVRARGAFVIVREQSSGELVVYIGLQARNAQGRQVHAPVMWRVK